jgi:hypothetical protein
MIATSATVFVQHSDATLVRLSRRFKDRFESIRLRDGRFVLHIPSVGSVLMSAVEDALRFSYVAQDAAADDRARMSLESIIRREFRGLVYTVGWEDSDIIPVPLRS